MSERIVTEAQNRGVPVITLRLGQMTPALNKPVFNPVDFWYHFFSSTSETKTYPDLFELSLEFTPVDYATSMITQLVQSEEPWSAKKSIIILSTPTRSYIEIWFRL